MHKICSYSLLVATILLIGLQPTIALAEPQEVTCTIHEIEGDVVVQRKNAKDWQIIKKGDHLNPGDVIQTRGAAKVGLLFVDGSIIRLRENSILKIKSLSQDSSTGDSKSSFQMVFGKLMAKVQSLRSEQSLFEVETPTSVAAVKGTIFIVEHDDGGTRIYLVDRENGHGVEVRAINREEAKSLANNGEKIVVVPNGPVGLIEKMSDEELQKLKDEYDDKKDRGDTKPKDEKEFFLVLNAPPDSFTTRLSDVVVSGETKKGATVKVNGQAVTVKPNGEFTTIINLTDGAHVISVLATDADGKELREENTVYVNTGTPTLTVVDNLTRPPFTNDTNYNMTIIITDPTALDRFRLRLDENGEPGDWFDVTGSVYTFFPKLSEGHNQIEIYCQDAVGHETYLAIERYRDTLAPILQLTRPASPVTYIPRVPPPPPGVELPPIPVSGFVRDPGECANPNSQPPCPVEVVINGMDVPTLDQNGYFSVEVPRVVGEVIQINVTAYDFLRNKSQVTYTVFIGK